MNALIGGPKTSPHMTGHAVDLTCPGLVPRQVARHLAKHLKGFDLIGTWVPVGFGPGQRAQLLTTRKAGGRTVMTSGIAA